jgi:hypothetical protein
VNKLEENIVAIGRLKKAILDDRSSYNDVKNIREIARCNDPIEAIAFSRILIELSPPLSTRRQFDTYAEPDLSIDCMSYIHVLRAAGRMARIASIEVPVKSRFIRQAEPVFVTADLDIIAFHAEASEDDREAYHEIVAEYSERADDPNQAWIKDYLGQQLHLFERAYGIPLEQNN